MNSALARVAESSPAICRIFTEHVRSTGDAGEVEGARLNAVLEALGKALRSELRRRGLWESPPAYLGIFGWDCWSGAAPRESGGAAGTPFGGGAFDELLAQCYSYIFVDRRRSLQAQRTVKPNVDGLVFHNIRHFLHELQREFDPLGFRIFEVVSSAVSACLAAGVLHVVGGDLKVRNDTVLAFDPAADPECAQVAGLDAWVSRLDDELLPDLVTARGKRLDVRSSPAWLSGLTGLRQQGFAVFRFGDLLAPCKDDVRARWSAILGGEARIEREGAPAGAAWIQRPGKIYEDLESFRSLVACVLAALERYRRLTERKSASIFRPSGSICACTVSPRASPEEAAPEAVPGWPARPTPPPPPAGPRTAPCADTSTDTPRAVAAPVRHPRPPGRSLPLRQPRVRACKTARREPPHEQRADPRIALRACKRWPSFRSNGRSVATDREDAARLLTWWCLPTPIRRPAAPTFFLASSAPGGPSQLAVRLRHPGCPSALSSTAGPSAAGSTPPPPPMRRCGGAGRSRAAASLPATPWGARWTAIPSISTGSPRRWRRQARSPGRGARCLGEPWKVRQGAGRDRRRRTAKVGALALSALRRHTGALRCPACHLAGAGSPLPRRS